jgi:hypothetical protein
MKKLPTLSSALGLLLLWGCGSTEEPREEPANAFAAMQQLSEKAEQMQNQEPVDPVDFRSLKEFLPAEAGGLGLKDATGEKSGAMGFSISKAEGRYQNDDGSSSLDIEIIDTGGIGGMALMGMAAWAMVEVDKETRTGYERSTRVGSYKGFEKYDNENKSGELNLIVADRYLLAIRGRQVSMDDMKSTLKDMNLDRLAALK